MWRCACCLVGPHLLGIGCVVLFDSLLPLPQLLRQSLLLLDLSPVQLTVRAHDRTVGQLKTEAALTLVVQAG